MSPKTIRVAKLVLSMCSSGLTFISRKNADKILDEKIAKKVAEELSKVRE